MCWLCALTLIGCCSEKRKSYMGKTISFIYQTSDLSTGGCEMLWQKSLTLMKESTSKALTGGEDKKRKKLTFYLQAKQLMPLDTIKYLPAAKRGSACRCSISFQLSFLVFETKHKTHKMLGCQRRFRWWNGSIKIMITIMPFFRYDRSLTRRVFCRNRAFRNKGKTKLFWIIRLEQVLILKKLHFPSMSFQTNSLTTWRFLKNWNVIDCTDLIENPRESKVLLIICFKFTLKEHSFQYPYHLPIRLTSFPNSQPKWRMECK